MNRFLAYTLLTLALQLGATAAASGQAPAVKTAASTVSANVAATTSRGSESKTSKTKTPQLRNLHADQTHDSARSSERDADPTQSHNPKIRAVRAKGEALRNAAIHAPAGDDTLLCLMYHRFVSDADYATLTKAQQIYTLSASRFEDHLRMIRSAGRETLSLDDALAFIRGDRETERPAVLITIDDGCRSALAIAAPLLRNYAMHATLFVTADPTACVFHHGCGGELIGRADPRLTDDEIRHWVNLGFDIGAHGLTHRPLDELPDMELMRELEAPRDALETLLGRPITALAAPRGRWNARVQRFARAAGYEAMFTSEKGLEFENGDEMSLNRFNLSGRWSNAKIRTILMDAATTTPIAATKSGESTQPTRVESVN